MLADHGKVPVDQLLGLRAFDLKCQVLNRLILVFTFALVSKTIYLHLFTIPLPIRLFPNIKTLTTVLFSDFPSFGFLGDS